MADVVVVSGTSTGVGKTWFAARTIERLVSAGLQVAVRKPVQSYAGDEATDAEVLSKASREDPFDVCPAQRWYPIAIAPPIAARELGQMPFTLQDLLADMPLPERGIVLVEGVGGPRSPLASDADTVALAKALNPRRVVIVAEAALGAINAVRLSAAAFASVPIVVALNRFNPAELVHRSNAAWLEEVDGLDVVTTPHQLAMKISAGAMTMEAR